MMINAILLRIAVDRCGVTALEYGLIAGVLAVGLVAGFSILSTSLSSAFTALTL